MNPPRDDLTRRLLAVLLLAALIAGSLWVLWPFLAPALWAVTIVITTWPVLLRVERLLGGRRGPAVAVMTLVLLAAFVGPITMGALAAIRHVDEIAAFATRLSTMDLPDVPAWLVKVPLVGEMLDQAWRTVADSGFAPLLSRLTPYLGALLQWTVRQIGTVGVLIAQSAIVVVLAAVMYARGETAAQALRRFGRRLAGPSGESVVVLSAQSVRAVAMGVGLTALVQSVLGGIGLALAGVPFAAFLTVVMFVVCLAQLGPFLVLLPAAAWLFSEGSTVWAGFLVVLTLVAGVLDNVLRPFLIQMGADMPLLLVFGGVVGGLLAFGLIGIFIGPVVLVVAYTLATAWVNGDEGDADAGAAVDGGGPRPPTAP